MRLNRVLIEGCEVWLFVVAQRWSTGGSSHSIPGNCQLFTLLCKVTTGIQWCYIRMCIKLLFIPVVQSSWLGPAKTIIHRLLVKNRGCYIVSFPDLSQSYSHTTWLGLMQHCVPQSQSQSQTMCLTSSPYHATQSLPRPCALPHPHTMQLSLIPRPYTTMRLCHMMQEVTVNRVRVPYHPWVMRVWRPWCL